MNFGNLDENFFTTSFWAPRTYTLRTGEVVSTDSTTVFQILKGSRR